VPGLGRHEGRVPLLRQPRIHDDIILAGHVAATATRFAAVPGTVLVLHDTTEFSFTRNTPDGIGSLSYVKGRHATDTACGVLLHSSLVVTAEGRPLGLAAAKFWSRQAFKGTNARKRKVNPTTVPIEEKESVRWLENVTRSSQALGDPGRCVHIGDREADIFELFHAARDAGAHFLVRTAVDRLAGRGGTTVARVMRRQLMQGVHEVEVRDDHGHISTAAVQVRFCQLTIHPSPAKRKRYGPLTDRHPRHRARQARGSGADPMEVTHRLAGGRLRRSGRKVELVRDAVEDRDVPSRLPLKEEVGRHLANQLSST
jgi:hypothetical protein